MKRLIGGKLWIRIVLAVVFASIIYIQINQPVLAVRTDTFRWMYEVERLVVGDIPYHDFTYPYLPGGLLLTGVWAKLFGVSIYSFHILLIIASGLIAILVWSLLYRLSGKPILSDIGTLAFTSSSLFASHNQLFSLNMYSPAVPVAIIGALILTIGMVSFWQSSNYRWWWLIWLGMLISWIGKFEQAFFAGVSLAIYAGFLIIYRRSSWRKLVGLLLGAILPAFALYVFLAGYVGYDNLIEGLAGYRVTSDEFPHISTFESLVKNYGYSFTPLIVFLCIGLFLQSLNKLQSRNRQGLSGHLVLLIITVLLAIGFIQHISVYRFIENTFLSLRWLALPFFLFPFFHIPKIRQSLKIPEMSAVQLAGIIVSLFTISFYGRSFFWINHFSIFVPIGILLVSIIIVQIDTSTTLANANSITSLGKWLGYMLLVYLVIASFLLLTVRWWYQQPTAILNTAQGTVKVLSDSKQVFDTLLRVVDKYTDDESYVLSCPYGGNINYMIDLPSSIGQTQCVRTRPSGRLQRIQLNRLEQNSPDLILVMDANNIYLSPERSRWQNPLIWDYVDQNYRYIYSFGNRNLQYHVYIPGS